MRTTRFGLTAALGILMPALVGGVFASAQVVPAERPPGTPAPAGAVPARPGVAQAPPAATATSPAPARPAPAPSPEERPVRDLIGAFAAAYSKPDVQALAALFTEDADVVDSAGETTHGRAAIADMYAASFQETPGLRLDSEVQQVRFLTPDVARVEGRSRLSTGTGDATEYSRFSTLLVRRGGKWIVAEIREYPAPLEDVTPYDRLKELEWMVGDWVDESQNVRASAHIDWAENKSYLVRTHRAEVPGEKPSSATMFLGWDPQNAQIKSWVFDSEGGHGEGLWTRSAENQWIVKAQGVLRDGRPNSATQIYTVVNKDSVRVSSIDRIIGGQIAPDISEVIMVRRPPQPAGAAPQPGAAGAPR